MLYVNRFRLDEDDEFQEVESVVNAGQVSMTKNVNFIAVFFLFVFAHAKHTGPQARHAWKKKKARKREKEILFE